MRTKLLALLFLAGSSLFAATHISVGVGLGGYGGYGGYGYAYMPPPPPPRVVYAPAYPRPGYTWIGGYWYPAGPRYHWRAGYWARPPYRGGYWVAPRYYQNRYHRGYWRR